MNKNFWLGFKFTITILILLFFVGREYTPLNDGLPLWFLSTSLGAGSLSGSRNVVRTSTGDLYAVFVDIGNEDLEVWYSADGSSWSEKDSGNKPAIDVSGASVAIDSLDVLHIVYSYNDDSDPKNFDLMYVTFDTLDSTSGDDLFNTPATIADVGAEIGDEVGISIDSNDVPHVACQGTGGGTCSGTNVYDCASLNGPSCDDACMCVRSGPNCNNIACTSLTSDCCAITDGCGISGGTKTVYYDNRVGGSWGGLVEVEGDTNSKNCINPDISIDKDNKPVIMYFNDDDDDVGTAIGDANDASSFTLYDIDADGSSTAGEQIVSLAVDGGGNHYVTYEDHSDGLVYLRKHAYGVAWSTWVARSTGSDAGINPSLVADTTDIYVFYEDPSSHDIYYEKVSGGSSWEGDSVLETGTYDNVIGKWSFWVDSDSTGSLISSTTYYFDASDAGPTDSDNKWDNEANAFNGEDTDYAECTATPMDHTYTLGAFGTNAPASGDDIMQVAVRFKGYTDEESINNLKLVVLSSSVFLGSSELVNEESVEWSPTETLSVPAGGWTWAKIQALEASLYVSATDYTNVEQRVYRGEIIVYSRESSTELDYLFSDGTNILWNKLDLGGAPYNYCSPPSVDNDWELDCEHNCILNDSFDLGTGKLVLNGTGKVVFNCEMNASAISINDTCGVAINYSNGRWAIGD